MFDGLQIRQVTPEDHELIRQVYAASNYGGGIKPEDVGFLATVSEEPVGAVRFTTEEGLLLLRGMMIKPAYQRQGIGSEMLRVVDPFIGNSACHLIGRAHLRSFYGNIGFAEVAGSEVPAFLRERAEGYIRKGFPCIFMYRKPKA